ncbi:MAG TPA: chemotaxis protein CheX [Candidatus Methylacidiphilales bacterium]|jgi:CheY-specific phosphatase CheX|nr:chemotaxis protein CheX [Candidatus Methylacidiphilales bacterium]
MPNPLPPKNRPAALRTSPMAPPKDLRAQFKLAPVPSGVEQIAGLVNGKESEMREITRIINRDQAVTQRCMLTAYPKEELRANATLDMATTRLGLSRVISFIVADLLQQSVIETFNTMIGIELQSEDPAKMPAPKGNLIIGSARFTGRATGDVLLAFPQPFGRLITAQLLGGSPEDAWPVESIHDALGELVNIVTGNLQSRLADAGLPSEMGLPTVKQQSVFPTVTILGGTSDRFYFRNGEYDLGVNLCISPFSKGPER